MRGMDETSKGNRPTTRLKKATASDRGGIEISITAATTPSLP